jgi:hypothetical protein
LASGQTTLTALSNLARGSFFPGLQQSGGYWRKTTGLALDNRCRAGTSTRQWEIILNAVSGRTRLLSTETELPNCPHIL